MNYQGNVVLITGGTGALGTAVTGAFLRAGAMAVVTYIIDAEVEPFYAAVKDRRPHVTLYKADVTKERDVRRVVQNTINKHGQIDVLVNIAGGFVGGIPVAETPEEKWDFMLNLNTKSAFLCSKAVLPHMLTRRAGRIVNISARAGLHGSAGLGAYAVAKSGVLILTQAIADEVKDQGITVNAVLPSIIDTPANRKAMSDADHTRWVRPEDIARVILFLASDDARAITGAGIPVYGRA
ncbi:MAG: SDR family oxidoreductase [Candidatus Latescibacteria bacterium]|nr:SDR family oxidoreductase [Candidatus Latescibacterota bacterium]